MNWKLILLLALGFLQSGFGATYYVKTDGNNALAGTNLATAWLTITYAETRATNPGDTVLVQAGTYDEYVILDGVGATNSPITFRAVGQVTNLNGFKLSGSWIVLDGFHLNRRSPVPHTLCPVIIGLNAKYCFVINNKIHDMPGVVDPIGAEAVGGSNSWNYSDHFVISNNWIWNSGKTAIGLHGSNHLVINNLISNTWGGDAFHPYGYNHVIRGNVLKEIGNAYIRADGCGNPVFDGPYHYDDIKSKAWNGGASTRVHTNAAGYCFIECTAYGSYGYPARWNILSNNGSTNYASCPALGAAWTVNDTNIISAPTDWAGYLDHGDFVQVWGDWLSGYYTWDQPASYPTIGMVSSNITIECNWAQGNYWSALAQTVASNGTNECRISNWTIRNNIFIDFDLTAGIAYPYSKWYNNLFYRCGGGRYGAETGNSPLTFSWHSPTNTEHRGWPYHGEVFNNAFIGCGANTNGGWFVENCTGGYSSPVDWGGDPYDLAHGNNYVCGKTNTWAVVPGFSDTNGVNGGDPKFVNAGAYTFDFRTMLGSPLIDAGKNIGAVTDDKNYETRPKNGTTDIGPYEFDPYLLMHLDFGQLTTNKIQDITGYNHDAWRMDSTNWIDATPGPNGLTAGRWHYAFDYLGYHASQYAAITNITNTALQRMTNGTIALWVCWSTNWAAGVPEPERGDVIMDAGDLIHFSTDQIHTNTWSLNFRYPNIASPFCTVFRRWNYEYYTNQDDYTYAFWTNQTRLSGGSNWYHIAITWWGNNSIVAYENGVLWNSNAFTLPYFEVGGAVPNWICLGAMQHSGTPAWGDGIDVMPNASWFKGNMADVRIYNRALSASEVANLYGGVGDVTSDETPPVPPPALRKWYINQARIGAIRKP